ncbi:hypothetical protein B0H13DRAFT_1890050 [Mycena leptocephala]|nr:hypothetical protein B0H13DRAFT_1890050 [Mycena leptocephala]
MIDEEGGRKEVKGKDEDKQEQGEKEGPADRAQREGGKEDGPAALNSCGGRNSVGVRSSEGELGRKQLAASLRAHPPPRSRSLAHRKAQRCKSCDDENEEVGPTGKERTSPTPLASTLLRVQHLRVAPAKKARLRQVVFYGKRKHGRDTGHEEKSASGSIVAATERNGGKDLHTLRAGITQAHGVCFQPTERPRKPHGITDSQAMTRVAGVGAWPRHRSPDFCGLVVVREGFLLSRSSPWTILSDYPATIVVFCGRYQWPTPKEETNALPPFGPELPFARCYRPPSDVSGLELAVVPQSSVKPQSMSLGLGNSVNAGAESSEIACVVLSTQTPYKPSDPSSTNELNGYAEARCGSALTTCHDKQDKRDPKFTSALADGITTTYLRGTSRSHWATPQQEFSIRWGAGVQKWI